LDGVDIDAEAGAVVDGGRALAAVHPGPFIRRWLPGVMGNDTGVKIVGAPSRDSP
jgi:hypothetical protein